MKDVFLLYDTCCFFEIVNLNYFMSQTGCEMIFCSLDGNPVRAAEGYSINVDMALKDVIKLMSADARAGHQTYGLVTDQMKLADARAGHQTYGLVTYARSFVVPGGDISVIDTDEVRNYLQELKSRQVLIGGICAGVDLLEHAGILNGLKSTHSADLDLVNDQHVITAKANAYVDFAIEVAKELDLFEDEADLQETINFWKYFKCPE